MGIFRFRMQNILNIKQKLEDQEKQNFAMLKLKLDEEEECLLQLKHEKEMLEEEARRMRNDRIDILKLKESNAQMAYKDDCIKKQNDKVNKARKNLELANIKLQKAITERKTYEKLKEKAFDEFVIEEGRQEAKEIDELTSYTYGRK